MKLVVKLVMKLSRAVVGCLLLSPVVAQTVVISDVSKLSFFTGTRTEQMTRQTAPPTGPYASYGSKITLTGGAHNTTGTSSLSGTVTMGANLTRTSPVTAENTQACNGHVEFCTRKYSNITFVAAHNSPFVRPGNSASNQQLDVTTQLDDGIRLLQAQMQWPANGSVPHFCHSSCDLLDAGPVTDWLTRVREWVDRHPYDVVTILLGNGNYSSPDLYVPFIEASGLVKYAYEAPYLPMALDDWPTLEHLILRGKRVVFFLDYVADQGKHPWLLDQFSQMWETPFDPLNRSFPCTVQRPPNLKADDAKRRLYYMNHNLNVEFDIFGTQLLVPAVALLNETNAAEGAGSVGLAANNCRSDWGRAPNFLNVDYYNYGSPPGSVFEVAARINNVTYSGTCCGTVSSAPALNLGVRWTVVVSSALVSSLCFSFPW
ncbi:hypothetical protein RJ55_03187 [Drechmeria coniospora]|nr:hypothetical protein RJ55_03187 [Drechmeria coniospora]